MKIKKALYGLLRNALLFYLKLAIDLKNKDFIINPYDLCVATKPVNGEVMAVVCHVYNLQVPHKHQFEVIKFEQYL